MSGSVRGKYIKDAVRFYSNLSDEIKLLNKQIAELLAALDGASPRLQQAPPGSNNENADILEASIGDLLGM
jgi:hypothetical protein